MRWLNMIHTVLNFAKFCQHVSLASLITDDHWIHTEVIGTHVGDKDSQTYMHDVGW